MPSPVVFSLTEAQAQALRELSWGGQPTLRPEASCGLIKRGLAHGAPGALCLTQLGRDAARVAVRLVRASPQVDRKSLPLPLDEAAACGPVSLNTPQRQQA